MSPSKYDKEKTTIRVGLARTFIKRKYSPLVDLLGSPARVIGRGTK